MKPNVPAVDEDPGEVVALLGERGEDVVALDERARPASGAAATSATQRARGGASRERPERGGVDVLALPELEHQQAPEPVAVVGAALGVVVEQPLHRRAARSWPRVAGALAEQEVARRARAARSRNQREIGTPKPVLPRPRPRAGARRRTPGAGRPCRAALDLQRVGQRHPSSSTSWSRSGERSSSECAIEAMSALSSRSPGR